MTQILVPLRTREKALRADLERSRAAGASDFLPDAANWIKVMRAQARIAAGASRFYGNGVSAGYKDYGCDSFWE